MSLISFLPNLIIPLNLSLALLSAATVLWLLRRRKTAIGLSVFALAWSLAWSLPITSLVLGGWLENRYPYVKPEYAPTVDAIVVLGGNTANGRNNWFATYNKNETTLRIDTAFLLHQAKRSRVIILSGGAKEGDISEAQGMAYDLKQLGVPETDLILENDSRTTYENALYSAAMLSARQAKKIMVVTSALHMPRAMAAFHKQNLHADIIAAPNPTQINLPKEGHLPVWLPDQRTLDASRSIIKEYAGLLVYWLRGWV